MCPEIPPVVPGFCCSVWPLAPFNATPSPLLLCENEMFNSSVKANSRQSKEQPGASPSRPQIQPEHNQTFPSLRAAAVSVPELTKSPAPALQKPSLIRTLRAAAGQPPLWGILGTQSDLPGGDLPSLSLTCPGEQQQQPCPRGRGRG